MGDRANVTASEHPCAGMAMDRSTRFPQRYQCSRVGIVERDGKWWCKQHDPDAVAARRKAADAKSTEDYRKFKEGLENATVGARLRAADPLRFAELLMELLMGQKP